jgi:hypothetical protein
MNATKPPHRLLVNPHDPWICPITSLVPGNNGEEDNRHFDSTGADTDPRTMFLIARASALAGTTDTMIFSSLLTLKPPMPMATIMLTHLHFWKMVMIIVPLRLPLYSAAWSSYSNSWRIWHAPTTLLGRSLIGHTTRINRDCQIPGWGISGCVPALAKREGILDLSCCHSDIQKM